MSGTNLTISSEHEGQEIHSETTIRDTENGNSDKESEFYYKPVRRGIALAQEIHDEYLICKICLDDYKSPKSLDCMHTFCEQCIENHAMSESTYKKYSDYRTLFLFDTHFQFACVLGLYELKLLRQQLDSTRSIYWLSVTKLTYIKYFVSLTLETNVQLILYF